MVANSPQPQAMNETSQFLMRHGLPLVFAAVFVEQMGLPIPAVPLLLTVGALSATGKFSLLMGIVVTMIACLIADIFWFYLGHYRRSFKERSTSSSMKSSGAATSSRTTGTSSCIARA